MHNKKLIRLGRIGFGFVVFHTAMIVIYAAPKGYLPDKVVEISAYYVDPLFQQKWNMFAPCPLLNHHVEIKYTFEAGEPTDWISPTADAVSKHMILRGSHHGDLAVAEYNTLFWVNLAIVDLELENESYVPDEKSKPFRRSNGYYFARNYAYGNSVYLFDKTPVAAEMRCDFHNVKTGDKRSLILPKFSWPKIK